MYHVRLAVHDCTFYLFIQLSELEKEKNAKNNKKSCYSNEFNNLNKIQDIQLAYSITQTQILYLQRRSSLKKNLLKQEKNKKKAKKLAKQRDS